jgi:hypothetical protein
MSVQLEEDERKRLLKQMLREGEGEEDLERILEMRESNIESERNEYKRILRSMLTDRGNNYMEDMKRLRGAFIKIEKIEPNTYISNIRKLVVNIISSIYSYIIRSFRYISF